jgi:hypothetical protein
MATEEEEKMEEMHSLLVGPTCKDALMALSMLDSVISSTDTNDRMLKLCMNFKIFY